MEFFEGKICIQVTSCERLAKQLRATVVSLEIESTSFHLQTINSEIIAVIGLSTGLNKDTKELSKLMVLYEQEYCRVTEVYKTQRSQFICV